MDADDKDKLLKIAERLRSNPSPDEVKKIARELRAIAAEGLKKGEPKKP